MKKLIVLCSFLFAMIAMPIQGFGQEKVSPKLTVVKFHADWCGSCKALGSVLTDLTNKLDGESVLFTALDFTNTSTKHQAHLLASGLGITEAVTQNNGTGFLLVIDSNTKAVKAKLTKTQSVKEMANAIKALL